MTRANNKNTEATENEAVQTENTGEQEIKAAETVNPLAHVAKETSEYYVTTNDKGKFVRKAKYESFSSIVPVTREEKIKMMNLLDGDDEGLPLSDHAGAEFKIVDVITNPYDSINEDTGEVEYGVLTYLFASDGRIFVTSSKSVYFTIKRTMHVFGEPHWDEEEAPLVKVEKKKGLENYYYDIKVIG